MSKSTNNTLRMVRRGVGDLKTLDYPREFNVLDLRKGYVSKTLTMAMGTVSDFIKKEEHNERQLADFMQWEYMDGQVKGSSYDFIAPDTSKIEAKFDWDSIKTGNHYLEIAQTSNDKKTWVPSGFSLSAEDADYWAVVNEDWLRLYHMNHLKAFIEENRTSLRVKETRARINNNQPGQYSKAYIIPFVFLDSICFAKLPNPVVRSK